MFNMDRPTEPLLMVGEELSLRPLAARERKRRAERSATKTVRGTPDPFSGIVIE